MKTKLITKKEWIRYQKLEQKFRDTYFNFYNRFNNKNIDVDGKLLDMLENPNLKMSNYDILEKYLPLENIQTGVKK